MSRWIRVAAIAFLLGGCAASHDAHDDAGPAAGSDAGTTSLDGGGSTTVDGGVTTGDPIGGRDGARCGPNVCRTAEICCDDRCGICAFEGECPSFECPDPGTGSRP
ncbi:MAG: hypothetical protein KC619_00500 [Myxococcales bacterium]|nr:hypothetical protein [Myxococcales bacterium]